MEVDGIAYPPSDDEELDSDIESYLYSQLHYSTDLTLGPDSELVIEKKDTSDDERLPEIIPIPKEEPNTKGEDIWAIHEKDLKGADAYRSSFGRNKRYYIDNEGIKPKCSNCKERGHTVTECPKVEICYLCGLQGHSRWSCPNDICYNCSEIGHISKTCNLPKKKYYAVCKRCWGRGHNRNSCPEIWRQYHLTAKDSGVIAKPGYDSSGILKTIRKIRYCFNCGEEGHFGHDCKKERPNWRPVNSPFIVYYDRCPFKSRKAEESMEGNLKRVAKDRETHEAKDWRTPEGHREDYLRIFEGRRENSWGISESHRENHWGISEGHREDDWRKSEGRREDRSHYQGEKAWEKFLHDQTKHERKNRRNGEIERMFSIGKHSHRPTDRDSDRKHSDIQKKLKENAAEKEKGNSSQSTCKRARNEATKKVNRNEERTRSVKKPERERSSELKREGGSKMEGSYERRREKSVRNVEVRFAKGKHEKVKKHDERAANEKEDSSVELRSSGIEKTGKEINKVVVVTRENAKRNSSAIEETQLQSRKRTWDSSLPEAEGLAGRHESPFKIIKSVDIVDLDESENFEFIDLDIYADSDSSLEVIDENSSGGIRDLPKEAAIEDEDTQRGRKKKLKLDDDYSTGTVGNRPHCSDTGKKREQTSDDGKALKSARDSGSRTESSRSLERARAKQKSIAGDTVKLKISDSFSSRQRKIGVECDVSKVDRTAPSRKKTDKAMSSKIEANAEKIHAQKQPHIILDTEEKQCMLIDFKKNNSARVNRSSKDLSDRQLKLRSTVHEKPESNRTVASNRSENIDLVENKLLAKGKRSNSLSDFVPKNHKAAINQDKLPPSPENTDVELRLSIDKLERDSSNDSLFGHESKILKKGKAENSPSICEDSKNVTSYEIGMTSSVPCSVPPYNDWDCIVDKERDKATEVPPEKVFIEDHAVWEDISDYDSLSDPGDFQFSNMHFEPVSSSDDDLRVKIDSLKSKRSQGLSSVVVDPSCPDMEGNDNSALDDDIGNNGSLYSEIQMTSMENVDRRKIDMTRYDPSQCNEDDVSSYQSYENYVDKKHPPLKYIDKANKNAVAYGKRKKPSQLDDAGLVKPNKRNIKMMQFIPSHSAAPTEADAWMERVAFSREERTASQMDRGTKGERFVSFRKKNNVKGKWKGAPPHAGRNSVPSRDAYPNELSGKAYRKMPKRNWRKEAIEKKRPGWLKGVANFRDKRQMNMPVVEFDGANRDYGKVPRAVERKGLNLAKRGRRDRMLRTGETRYSPVNDTNRTHRMQQRSSKCKVKLNRGFKSSDIAKSFSFSAVL